MPAHNQRPAITTFGATSTTDEVLDGVRVNGKRVLVTGVSAGLGVETARALVAHGADVVGAARDLAKAKRATAGVNAVGGNGGEFELVELDLASLDSVRVCANALVDDGRPFDLVIANAGVMACPFGKTADGFETQFGTNHLGHFVLVNRVASLMKPGSRLVNRLRPATAIPTSISTIRTSSARPMILGSPTGARRPPTFCSLSSSIAATKPRASALPPSTPGASRPSFAILATRRLSSSSSASTRRRALRASPTSSSKRSRRARRPASGRASARRPTRSGAAIARTAMWRKSSPTRSARRRQTLRA